MSDSGNPDVFKVGDNVRVVYPKQKYRSPHRTDGIYKVKKIDPSQDICWVKYLEEGSNKVTIIRSGYIQHVITSKFKGLK